ncbi:DNA-binding protein [Brevibacillus laterosporus]|nr:helix-turn-helix domain-containing protein [Brevibacillus laterosporus]TPG68916.1 DNA-binding protein [Brevibacillus laterosporus]
MVTHNEVKQFFVEHVMTTSQVIKYLGISRQGLHDLVKREKIKPIYEEATLKLYFRTDIEKWKEQKENK